jgi:hypothetical protein
MPRHIGVAICRLAELCDNHAVGYRSNCRRFLENPRLICCGLAKPVTGPDADNRFARQRAEQ